MLAILVLPTIANAQPPRLADLPKQASTWPPAWGALARDLAAAPDDFEKIALERAAKLLAAEPTPESHRLAETILAATLRHHLSVRRTAPLADNPWRQTQTDLEDRLAAVRTAWLALLDDADALGRADMWLPTTSADSPLRAAILERWLGQAKQAIAKDEFKSARGWANRLEANFDDARAEPIRKPLRARAATLLKESQTLPDPQAIRALEEALEYWPRLPDARDALERRKGTYRSLVVGVRALPTQLSPATAWTEVEKQSLALLFESLLEAEQVSGLGQRYRPGLADALPTDVGLTAPFALRRDAFWSSGERVTAADVRHTALLMNKDDAVGRSGLWREYLDVPRPGANVFRLDIHRRQGLFDPLAPLTFWVLPQYYQGKQLQRLDDPDFAKAPVGSGPFQLVGRTLDAGKAHVVFQANPDYLRGGVSHLREVRMVAWTDAKKDLPRPLPALIVDAPTDQLLALKELGYAAVPIHDASTVQFLAVNQRKPALASASVRRAIALALDRQTLVARHFQAAGQKHHATANGLVPRGSWASCPRVPVELHQADLARTLARKAKAELAQVDWTLKYPAGDRHLQAACDEMAGAIASLFREAGVKASVRAVGLPAHELRKAIVERDYDLAYLSEENLDDPVRLALLFDADPSALRAGGSNYLGCDDVKLQELLHSALKHRQFSVAQAGMHAVHEHLNQTMPVIPLWQLELHVLVQSTLRIAPIPARHVFSRIIAWQF